MKKKSILLIGDSCRDIFVYCDALRLAPDLPVPVLDVVEQKENPGMAKNVERNIRAIYPRCVLVTNPNWRSVTKTRYMHRASNQGFIRVDSKRRIRRVDVRKIQLRHYDIVAISDYDKGFLSKEDIRYICDNHPTVFVDSKKVLGDWVENAKFIKINNHEYERSRAFLTPKMRKKLIQTKGGQGAVFGGTRYPVDKVEVKDVAGAGDSFFAALIVRYAETGDIKKSIFFANQCAAEVVRHRGVSLIRRP